MRKIIFIAFISMLYLYGCSNSEEPEDIDSFVLELEKKLNTYPFEFTKEDSLFAAKKLDNNFTAMKEYRIENFKKFVRNYSWVRASKYLLLDSLEVKKEANKLGFNQPYYYLEYLRSDTINNKQKKEIMDKLRMRYHSVCENEEKNKELDDIQLLQQAFSISNKKGCGDNCTCVN